MDHRVQLLASHKTTQKSDCMSKSVVQTLLELCHEYSACDTASLSEETPLHHLLPTWLPLL